MTRKIGWSTAFTTVFAAVGLLVASPRGSHAQISVGKAVQVSASHPGSAHTEYFIDTDPSRGDRLAICSMAIDPSRNRITSMLYMSSDIRQWYQRWKRKKPLRIARALVAQELAKSVYVVLHDQVEFNQHFKGTPLMRQKQARCPRRASPSA